MAESNKGPFLTLATCLAQVSQGGTLLTAVMGTQADRAGIKCRSEENKNMVKSTLTFKAFACISLAQGSHTPY